MPLVLLDCAVCHSRSTGPSSRRNGFTHFATCSRRRDKCFLSGHWLYLAGTSFHPFVSADPGQEAFKGGGGTERGSSGFLRMGYDSQFDVEGQERLRLLMEILQVRLYRGQPISSSFLEWLDVQLLS